MSLLEVFKYALLAIAFIIGGVHAKTSDECVTSKFEEISSIVKSCKNIILDGVSVPAGKQLVLDLSEGSTLTFRGNTSFNFYEWKGPLVSITGDSITVIGEGGSVLDGLGPLYWDGQGTWGNIIKPKFVKIQATNAIFDGISVRNCPVACISIKSSNNVLITNWKIDNLDGDQDVAPDNKFAHNTDGFGVVSCQNLIIENSAVYNQDDCVALTSGKNITIRNVLCHGSHGLSISAKAETIEDVLIENSIVTTGRNGIHVKTHVDTGPGLIRNVLYRNITLIDSQNYGINIQQNYQNLPGGHSQDVQPNNNIPIYNLTMTNIVGDVLEQAVPVYVLCAVEGCFDWKWDGVNLTGGLNDNCTNYSPEGYNCSNIDYFVFK